MASGPPPSGQQAVRGAATQVLARLLLTGVGALTYFLLTRQLRVEEYGLFELTAACVGIGQWVVSALWGRATIKLVGAAEDPTQACG